MPDDLIRTAAIGVVGSLLAFELVAALRSWLDAAPIRRGETGSYGGRSTAGPILLSRSSAIRDHFAQRRSFMNALRPRYAVLRTGRYGRQLRTAIGRIQPARSGEIGATCPSCRSSRLKGQAHCAECRQRLLVPVMSA